MHRVANGGRDVPRHRIHYYSILILRNVDVLLGHEHHQTREEDLSRGQHVIKAMARDTYKLQELASEPIPANGLGARVIHLITECGCCNEI